MYIDLPIQQLMIVIFSDAIGKRATHIIFTASNFKGANVIYKIGDSEKKGINFSMEDYPEAVKILIELAGIKNAETQAEGAFELVGEKNKTTQFKVKLIPKSSGPTIQLELKRL